MTAAICDRQRCFAGLANNGSNYLRPTSYVYMNITKLRKWNRIDGAGATPARSLGTVANTEP